jgi:hypothetical protein
MSPRIWTAIALAAGLGLGAIGDRLLRPLPPVKEAAPLPVEAAADGDDDDALLAANANLVSSLQECNRRLAGAGQPRVAAPVATPTPAPSSSGRFRGRRGEPAKADWERFAQEGIVPYNIPCIRDTPFTPSERQLDRLGLAPHDGEVLRDAYAKSNQRMMAQIQPLCARVLGTVELANRVGASACMSAIIDGARRENADKMQQALVRVAEVNSGKRQAPKGEGLDPVEALLLGFAAESKAFEGDLAASLGPEDAKRIAGGRGLCSERGTVRAKE